ncbi:hypothetical protein LQE85_08780 [Stenotrophomonas rhizophila]|uniref:hypothetical protein n=1 Tax=Stenotrophomonas rhizophila TaxID=216778 RepID=UPI00201CB9DB|nr:hypothetical protein [Stenotrophomonas rhizophila]UQY89276.1 hypothetical protein LQE85_08780 [Stenotrophomonas rhizophila]
MDGLDVLTPPTRCVPFRGEQVVVKPLRLEQVGPFVTASRTIIARVAMLAGMVEGAAAVEVGAIVLDMLEQDGPEVASALAVAADREAAWIAGGTLDEVADLLEAVVGLNRDFFARRLQRLIQAARPPAAGSTASPTSSST